MNALRIKSWYLGAFLALTQIPSIAVAESSYDHSRQADTGPSGGAMVIDATVIRPLMIVTTVVGSALFLVSLPFSALGGNVDESADNLVVAPARSAFKRPLGQFD